MSLNGKWRIIAMPDFEADYPDMVEPAYILFKGDGAGEFAFGCCTGHIWEASSTEATGIDFSRDGSDEMTEVSGEGSAQLQPDGSLRGEICYRHGDEYSFIARKWTSSTACYSQTYGWVGHSCRVGSGKVRQRMALLSIFPSRCQVVP